MENVKTVFGVSGVIAALAGMWYLHGVAYYSCIHNHNMLGCAVTAWFS